MRKKFFAVSILVALCLTPLATNVVMATQSVSVSDQIYDGVELLGKKKKGNLVLTRKTSARIYVDLDTNTIYVTLDGTRYKSENLGGSSYGFEANDGYYYTFTYLID